MKCDRLALHLAPCPILPSCLWVGVKKRWHHNALRLASLLGGLAGHVCCFVWPWGPPKESFFSRLLLVQLGNKYTTVADHHWRQITATGGKHPWHEWESQMSLSSLQGGVRQVLDAEANTMFLSQKRAFSAMAQESRRAWKEDKRSLQELMIKNSMSSQRATTSYSLCMVFLLWSLPVVWVVKVAESPFQSWAFCQDNR